MKTLFSTFAFLLFGALSPSSVTAQSYLSGTITLPNGSVESGSISWSNKDATPQHIRFKYPSGQETDLGPMDIVSYEVTRRDGKVERFVSRIVRVSRLPASTALLELRQLRMETDTVFLHWLVQSPGTSLLELHERSTDHFFIEKDSLRELIYRDYARDKTVAVQPAKGPHYRQQLLAAAYGYPQLTKRIQEMAYRKRPLTALVNDLNLLAKQPVTYRFAEEKWKPRVYLLGGVTITDIHGSWPDQVPGSFSINHVNFKPSIQPAPGLGLSLPIPETKGKIWFYNDLTLRILKTTNPNEVKVVDASGNEYMAPAHEFDLSWLRLHSAVRCMLPGGLKRFFLQAGFMNAWLISNHSTYARLATYAYRIEPLWQGNVKKKELGVALGGGYTWGHLGVEARYDIGKGFSSFNHLNVPTNTISLLASWRL